MRWSSPFVEPIPLPRGKELVTLEDAGPDFEVRPAKSLPDDSAAQVGCGSRPPTRCRGQIIRRNLFSARRSCAG
jgi:hypothetical protein